MISIYGLKVKLRDEYAGNAAVGLYEVSNIASYPETGSIEYLYRLNEGTGTTAADDSSNGNDASLTTVTWGTSREGYGKCLNFDGTAGYLSVPDITASTSFTFSADVYVRSDGENNAGRLWQAAPLSISTTDESGGFVKITAADGFGANGVSTLSIPINTWCRITVVYDGTDFLIYLNGVDITDTQVSSVAVRTTATTHYIGNNDSSDVRCFDGYIDNPCFWTDTALTPAQVATLYAIGASPAELRVMETEPATTPTMNWSYGVLISTSPISGSVDIRRGGNRAIIDGMDFTLDNAGTENSGVQLWKYFQDNGISLIGCITELYEFIDTDADGEITFTGSVGDSPEWDENNYSIRAESIQHRREAVLGTVINNELSDFTDADNESNGKMVPVTFGAIGRASAIKVVNKENQITVEDFNLDIWGIVPATGTKVFKCSSSSGVTMTVQFGRSGASGAGTEAGRAYLAGKWVKIVEGQNSGSYRKIVSVGNPNTNTVCDITLDQVFDTDITSEAWFTIYDIEQDYRLDTWPLASFGEGSADDETLPVSAIDSPNYIYGFTDNLYLNIPQYALSIAAGITGNNILDAQPIFYNSSLSSVNSFWIASPADFSVLRDANEFGIPTLSALGSDGCSFRYSNGPSGFYDFKWCRVLDLNNAIDKDPTTYADIEYFIYGSGNQVGGVDVIELALIFKLTPPTLPKGLSIDSAYLLLSVVDAPYINALYDAASPLQATPTQGGFMMRTRRFPLDSLDADDKAITTYRPAFSWYDQSNITGDVGNLLDEYLTSSVDSTNLKFFQELIGAANINGYTALDIPSITDEGTYQSIESIMFGFNTKLTFPFNRIYVPIFMRLKIYNVAVMIKSSIDIGDSIYVPIYGRIFNDTWGSRKTAANVITSPVDTVEHVLRLGNWSEIQAAPSAGWGKGYADSALIKTGAADYGSFDHPNLTPVKSFSAARQIFDVGETGVDDLVRSLCRNFFLCSYIGADGYENITYIADANPEVDLTFDLGDIVGRVGVTKEPPSEDIFCTPTIYYAWDEARNKYTKTLSVDKVWEETFDATYVTGFKDDSVEAENIWNKCRALWLKYQQINEVPTEYSELPWTREDYDAKRYLETFVDWMDKREITFSVPYELGRTVHETMRIALTLPFQTDGVQVKFIVSNYTKDKNADVPVVEITGFLLTEITDGVYRIFDTYDSTNPDWQKTYTEAGADLYQDSF